MGRRALPKLDPRIEFSHLLVALGEPPTPLDMAALFGRPGELEIEVGSGKGMFLLNASQRSPQTNFLGIEISAKYADWIAYRLAKQSRVNVRVIQVDGLKLFREYLADQSASAVHVYFPDPWWKARHRKRRLMRESFVSDVHRVLKPGGALHFWTDVEEYFESTCDLIRDTVPLTGPLSVEPEEPQHDLDYRTHFERRMRRNEHPVFRGRFVRLPSGTDQPRGPMCS